MDGRTARRDRNRVAVLDAVIELFAEDNLQPGVHEVAARSGVSLRSVYRYFEHADELVASAIERQFELAAPLFHIADAPDRPLHDRIGMLVEHRLALYEHVRVVYHAAVVQATSNSHVRDAIIRTRTMLSEQVAKVLHPDLDGARDALVTADVLLQLESLEHLRTLRRMSLGHIERYLIATLSRLLTDAAAA